MASPALRTALVAKIDAPELERVHRATYRDAAARGIPLHVTVLFPFVDVDALDGALDRVRGVLARHRPFEFHLTRVEMFPEVVWLAPEPAAPFRAVTVDVYEAFPDHPPYGGEHAANETIPHATLAVVPADRLEATVRAIEARASPLLPVAQKAREITILEELAPEQWRERLRVPLGR